MSRTLVSSDALLRPWFFKTWKIGIEFSSSIELLSRKKKVQDYPPVNICFYFLNTIAKTLDRIDGLLRRVKNNFLTVYYQQKAFLNFFSC